MTSRFLPFLLAGTVLGGLATPALAGNSELELAGDGSMTNNRDLLRGSFECGYDCPSAEPPSEPYDPPFDIDWSVALRGAYIQDNTTSRFETSLIPALAVHHEGLRSTFDFDAEAEFVKSTDTVARLGALRLSGEGEYGLDAVTNFATEGDLEITQDAPDDPIDPLGYAVAPVILDGDFAATLTRDVGIAFIGLRGSVGRTQYGDATLNDTTIVDNSSSNNTRYGAGLRVSHQLTPIVSAFGDVSAEHRTYDAASPVFAVFLDSTDYVGKVGLDAEIGTILEAEGAIGAGLRRFDDASLADVQVALYEASLTFRPDETLELTSTFTSSIEGPGPSGTGTASIDREATFEARYKVNTWWSVWAAAGWYSSTAIAAPDFETGYDVGVGSEYLLNTHVALTADYTFSHSEATGTAPLDTHTAAIGVKVTR